MQKQPVLLSSGWSLAKSHLDTIMVTEIHVPGSLTLGKRGAMEDGIPYVLQSKHSSTSSLSVVHIGTLPHTMWKSFFCIRISLVHE